MKRMLFVMLAVMLLLGACASNRSFKAQQDKMLSLEANQNSQEALIEMANKDINANREKLAAIIIRLNMMEEELQQLTPLMVELKDLQTELGALSQELAAAKDQSTELDARMNDLSTDTNETLDEFTEYIADIQDKSESYASKTDLEQLIEESSALASTLDQITDELQAIHQELAANETEDLQYKEVMADFKRKVSSLESQLEEARQEMTRMGSAKDADIDALRMKVDNVNKELTYLTQDLEQVISKERTAAEKRRNEAMKKQYEAALKEYNNRHHENSIIQFEEFLKAYPDSPLSPNANYWIGENYYAAGVFAKALREFQNVVARYPDHPKAWDAQLKVGITYFRMDDKVSAKDELLKLKAQYPDYPSMKTVDKYLRYIDK